MVRVARPGGVVAACVWDSHTMPLLRSFWDSALAISPARAGAIDDGCRVGYERPEELADLWAACGLLEVTTGELLVHAEYEPRRSLAAIRGRSGTLGCLLHSPRRHPSAPPPRRGTPTAQRPGRAPSLTARAWWVGGLVPAS